MELDVAFDSLSDFVKKKVTSDSLETSMELDVHISQRCSIFPGLLLVLQGLHA
jgi:hypothetical protein